MTTTRSDFRLAELTNRLLEFPLDTLPTPLDSLAAAPGGLDDFRISTPGEIVAMLRQLHQANVLVNLNASDGATYTTTVWTVDPSRGTLSFSADSESLDVQAMIEAEDAVAVAYLDRIKLQFDVQCLLLVRGGKTSAMSCAIPREMFRFQRRSSFRVRPLLRATPTAKLRHPMIPDMTLNLRVMDVSIGGFALFLPDDVPPLQPGVVMNGVQIDLDVDTRLVTSLRLQHVASLNPDSHGMRLGCEMVNPTAETLRSMQCYIDQTQKRQRMLSL